MLIADYNSPGGRDNAKFKPDREHKEAYAKNPPPPWIEDAETAKGHPDSYDIKLVVKALKDKVNDYIS